jgi:hypothetical protein
MTTLSLTSGDRHCIHRENTLPFDAHNDDALTLVGIDIQCLSPLVWGGRHCRRRMVVCSTYIYSVYHHWCERVEIVDVGWRFVLHIYTVSITTSVRGSSSSNGSLFYLYIQCLSPLVWEGRHCRRRMNKLPFDDDNDDPLTLVVIDTVYISRTNYHSTPTMTTLSH